MKPGTKEICRALINSRHQNAESKKYLNTQIEVKLDSCGSVSIGHSSLLSNIKSCKDYNVPTVILKGIGGKTEPLTKVGILKHVLPNRRTVKWLCYVFDTPVGHSQQLLLLSISAIKLSDIDINYHVDESFEGRSAPLRFKGKASRTDETYCRAETYYCKTSKDDLTPCEVYRS